MLAIDCRKIAITALVVIVIAFLFNIIVLRIMKCLDSSIVSVSSIFCKMKLIIIKLLENSIKSGNGSFLMYHQTDNASAQLIVQSQFFKLGDINGVAGEGIYFAGHPFLTFHKATSHGAILICNLSVGVICNITQEQRKNNLENRDAAFAWQWMHQDRRNCDSILLTEFYGDEYIFYNSNQITNISIYSYPPQCLIGSLGLLKGLLKIAFMRTNILISIIFYVLAILCIFIAYMKLCRASPQHSSKTE